MFDLNKKQKLMLDINDLLNKHDALDESGIIALVQTLYVILKELTIPDEWGKKNSRIREMWSGFLEKTIKDFGDIDN